jgi:hypothetical protein
MSIRLTHTHTHSHKNVKYIRTIAEMTRQNVEIPNDSGKEWHTATEHFVDVTKEPLLKGKAQYNRPPCTNWFRSAAFDIANIIHFFTITSYLNEEEANRTEPFPFVSVP